MPAEREQAHAPVLVVDDDPDFREVIVQTLEAAGYRTVCASGQEEALAVLERERPRLVLTDLVMGRLDSGFAIGRRVKEDPRLREVPVVITTAISSQRGFDFQPREEGDLESMGADAFLPKPFPPERLLDLIEQLLPPGEEKTP